MADGKTIQVKHPTLQILTALTRTGGWAEIRLTTIVRISTISYIPSTVS